LGSRKRFNGKVKLTGSGIYMGVGEVFTDFVALQKLNNGEEYLIEYDNGYKQIIDKFAYGNIRLKELIINVKKDFSDKKYIELEGCSNCLNSIRDYKFNFTCILDGNKTNACGMCKYYKNGCGFRSK
jgi:hypothetical protein